MIVRGVALFVALLMTRVACASDATPDRVLHGHIDGTANLSYLTVPFEVPAGIGRITVQFEYSGHDRDKTTIDLGLAGPGPFDSPTGLRGWTGGSKRLFTVSATDATPSFAPGPIVPGRWSLLLGVPNIRPGAQSEYTARIWFGHPDDPAWLPAVLNPPLREEARWYRGDLHMHGAHSDGSCPSQSGQRVPCPLFLTVQAAVAAGLDFIALTDHNATSQANDIRELQPYFDRLLLIPGREITTFTGHANLLGTTAPVDFRIDGVHVKDWNALERRVASLQGILSLNHPIRPSGEVCMGCGWTAAPPIDMAGVQAIEAVNGGDEGTPFSGLPFWESQLAKGLRITAIGGSDNHDASLAKPRIGSSLIGTPSTVVWAPVLSMPAILDGIRAGHVFVDTQGTHDRLLEVRARSGTADATMGDELAAAAGANVAVHVHVTHVAGMRLRVFLDGKALTPQDGQGIDGDDRSIAFDWHSDGGRHWLRAEVDDTHGKPLLLGNPVYLNWRR